MHTANKASRKTLTGARASREIQLIGSAGNGFCPQADGEGMIDALGQDIARGNS